ncbi:MAG: CD225/dispanin family protein [Muribaculaceae bacterium]|nr:CD225/dispanin family protein [Muribaculaceae bacterium]
MKVCPNPKCGKTIENDKAKFCRYCGAELPVIPEALAPEGEVLVQQPRDFDEGIILSPTTATDKAPSLEPMSHSHPSDGIPLGFADNTRIPKTLTTVDGYSNNENQMTAPKKPNNNMVWAILTTLLCSPLFGIIAIVQASKVNALYASGDYNGAQQASSRAGMWSIVAAIAGLIGFFIIIANGGL